MSNDDWKYIMLFILIGALIIGMSLGLLGAGGSIFTLPILIFLLHRPEKLAIAESMAIIGIIALIGALSYGIRQQIHWKSVFLFGLPGILGSYLGAQGSYYISEVLQLVFFAFILWIAAWIMLFNPFSSLKPFSNHSIWITIGEGLLLGIITGFIGVGGGFLMVPVLTTLCALSMPFAVGTSLTIICLNAFTGFIGQFFVLQRLNMHVDWIVIMSIAFIGILGEILGGFISKNISQEKLRQLFGLSIFLIGTYILLAQI